MRSPVKSRIDDVTIKQGRSGVLVFVNVHHALRKRARLALSEEHDIVYRDNPRPDVPTPEPQVAAGEEDFAREIVPDPVLLFRYSALTFNGPSHSLRPHLRDRGRGLPGAGRARTADRHAAGRSAAAEMPRASVRRFSSRPCGHCSISIRLRCAAGASVAGKPSKSRCGARDHDGFLAMQASAELA